MANFRIGNTPDDISPNDRLRRLGMVYQLILSWEVPGAIRDPRHTDRNNVGETKTLFREEVNAINASSQLPVRLVGS